MTPGTDGTPLDGVLLPEVPRAFVQNDMARQTLQRATDRAEMLRACTTYNRCLEIAEHLEAEAQQFRRLVTSWRGE